jgi:hypothetical protein
VVFCINRSLEGETPLFSERKRLTLLRSAMFARKFLIFVFIVHFQAIECGRFIDYRWDNEKTTLELGQHLGTIVELKTPGFQNAGHQASPSSCSSANSKTILHGLLSIPNPNFSEFAFFGN